MPTTTRFVKVRNGKNQEIRGLWKRGQKFYAQITVIDPESGEKRVTKKPLEATTVGEAVAELEALRTERRKGTLKSPVGKGGYPPFSKVAEDYLKYLEGPVKAQRTRATESHMVRAWAKTFSHLRVNAITPTHVRSFLEKKLREEKVVLRTLNYYITVLHNIFKWLNNERGLPLEKVKIKPYKYRPLKRPLISDQELQTLLKATEGIKLGEILKDAISLMAYSGVRVSECMGMRWEAVDFSRKQLIVGLDPNQTKAGKTRFVDFNSNLENLLTSMAQRRNPTSPWLFPSDRREGEHYGSLRYSMETAVEKAGLPDEYTDFHLLRHYFISKAVMAGIDYMTIAGWVGHSDGGVLIGKVYGHLSNEHRRNQAAKLQF